MSKKENSFYAASMPREDGRMPLANLIENLARFKGSGSGDVYLYPEKNLVICVNDKQRFSIAWEGSEIVFSSQKGELFLGEWSDLVESHRDEIEDIYNKIGDKRTNMLFAESRYQLSSQIV